MAWDNLTCVYAVLGGVVGLVLLVAGVLLVLDD